MRVLLLFLLIGASACTFAQAQHSLTMDEVLNREMPWKVSVRLASDTTVPAVPIKTVRDALDHLDSQDLREVDMPVLNDFLDSTATELWRVGSPAILFWCDERAMWNEKEAKEKTCGCQYVCAAYLGRAVVGVNAFNRRTAVLLGLRNSER